MVRHCTHNVNQLSDPYVFHLGYDKKILVLASCEKSKITDSEFELKSINMELIPNQIIDGTVTSARIRSQDVFFYQVGQLALGCGAGDMAYAGVLTIREAAFKSTRTGIKEVVKHFALPMRGEIWSLTLRL